MRWRHCQLTWPILLVGCTPAARAPDLAVWAIERDAPAVTVLPSELLPPRAAPPPAVPLGESSDGGFLAVARCVSTTPTPAPSDSALDASGAAALAVAHGPEVAAAVAAWRGAQERQGQSQWVDDLAMVARAFMPKRAMREEPTASTTGGEAPSRALKAKIAALDIQVGALAYVQAALTRRQAAMQAWAAAVAASHQARAAGQAVALAQSLLDSAQQRYRSGAGTQSDVVMSELLVGRARLDRQRWQEQVVVARYALAAQVGKDAEWADELRLSDRLSPPAAPELPGAHSTDAPSVSTALARTRAERQQALVELARLQISQDASWTAPSNTMSEEVRLDSEKGVGRLLAFAPWAAELAAASLSAAAEAAQARVDTQANRQAAAAERADAQRRLVWLTETARRLAERRWQSELQAYASGASDFSSVVDALLERVDIDAEVFEQWERSHQAHAEQTTLAPAASILDILCPTHGISGENP